MARKRPAAEVFHLADPPPRKTRSPRRAPAPNATPPAAPAAPAPPAPAPEAVPEPVTREDTAPSRARKPKPKRRK